MKKLEVILVLVALLSFVLSYFNVPFSLVLMLIAFNVLAMFYFVFSFALINGLGFRGMFKKTSYSGVNAFMIVLAVLFGWFLSNIIVGLTMSVNEFPGAGMILPVGIIGAAVITLVSLLGFYKTKKAFIKNMLTRFLIFGGLGILAFFLIV